MRALRHIKVEYFVPRVIATVSCFLQSRRNFSSSSVISYGQASALQNRRTFRSCSISMYPLLTQGRICKPSAMKKNSAILIKRYCRIYRAGRRHILLSCTDCSTSANSAEWLSLSGSIFQTDRVPCTLSNHRASYSSEVFRRTLEVKYIR